MDFGKSLCHLTPMLILHFLTASFLVQPFSNCGNEHLSYSQDSHIVFACPRTCGKLCGRFLEFSSNLSDFAPLLQVRVHSDVAKCFGIQQRGPTSADTVALPFCSSVLSDSVCVFISIQSLRIGFMFCSVCISCGSV